DVGDARSAGALRVHDVDPLGGDEAFQSAGASPDLERIDRRIHEGNPFAAGSLELRNERTVLGCHDGARADFPQRRGHIYRSAGDRLLAQCRHDLQDGRCGHSARVCLPLVVAHGVLSLAPRRLVCRSAVLVFNGCRGPNMPPSGAPGLPQMNDLWRKFLSVGTGIAARQIAVRRRDGATPGLFWLGGFKSDMRGTKAQALDRWAQENGRAMTRFDYSGHGESSGNFTDG